MESILNLCTFNSAEAGLDTAGLVGVTIACFVVAFFLCMIIYRLIIKKWWIKHHQPKPVNIPLTVALSANPTPLQTTEQTTAPTDLKTTPVTLKTTTKPVHHRKHRKIRGIW